MVRAYYERHSLWENWRHHVGHAIGIRYHEAPFLDLGDRTEIRPGMVFTVEPGLYAASSAASGTPTRSPSPRPRSNC